MPWFSLQSSSLYSQIEYFDIHREESKCYFTMSMVSPVGLALQSSTSATVFTKGSFAIRLSCATAFYLSGIVYRFDPIEYECPDSPPGNEHTCADNIPQTIYWSMSPDVWIHLEMS